MKVDDEVPQQAAAQNWDSHARVWDHASEEEEKEKFMADSKIKYFTYELSVKNNRINNVDIIYDFPLVDKNIIIIGCSNRTNQSIDLFFKLKQKDGKYSNKK